MERHLFRFGEEVVRVPVQDHPADRANRNLFFGNEFRGHPGDREIEGEFIAFRDQLDPEFPPG